MCSKVARGNRNIESHTAADRYWNQLEINCDIHSNDVRIEYSKGIKVLTYAKALNYKFERAIILQK